MALATIGLPVPDREVLFGPGVRPAVDRRLSGSRRACRRTHAWDVIRAYRATYNNAAASLAIPFVGITDVLERLAAVGVPMAVATSKPSTWPTASSPRASSVAGWTSSSGPTPTPVATPRRGVAPPGLPPALPRTARDRRGGVRSRARRLDALPHTLAHNDLHPANVHGDGT